VAGQLLHKVWPNFRRAISFERQRSTIQMRAARSVSLVDHPSVGRERPFESCLLDLEE